MKGNVARSIEHPPTPNPHPFSVFVVVVVVLCLFVCLRVRVQMWFILGDWFHLEQIQAHTCKI